MKIAGVQKSSFVDYPGKMAMVVFTPGCNMDCFYCHNRHIIGPQVKETAYTQEDILSMLDDRRGFMDALVISGGEPTLQRDLQSFMEKVKRAGYPIKLDSNGTHPEVLRSLIQRDLVDYIAMDLKAPFARYPEICGVPTDLTEIRASVELLMEGLVEYEFRTTLVPQLGEEDILQIAGEIRGADRYILQQYRKPGADEGLVDYRALQPSHPDGFIRKMAVLVSEYVRSCETRGVA